MYVADRDLRRALYSMAQLDAEAVGGAVKAMEQGRAAGMAHLAHRLAEQEILRRDVTAGQAADLLWVLTSFESFDLLYTGRALTADQTAETLIGAAERSLANERGRRRFSIHVPRAGGFHPDEITRGMRGADHFVAPDRRAEAERMAVTREVTVCHGGGRRWRPGRPRVGLFSHPRRGHRATHTICSDTSK
jgi:hypothetical protein